MDVEWPRTMGFDPVYEYVLTIKKKKKNSPPKKKTPPLSSWYCSLFTPVSVVFKSFVCFLVRPKVHTVYPRYNGPRIPRYTRRTNGPEFPYQQISPAIPDSPYYAPTPGPDHESMRIYPLYYIQIPPLYRIHSTRCSCPLHDPLPLSVSRIYFPKSLNFSFVCSDFCLFWHIICFSRIVKARLC